MKTFNFYGVDGNCYKLDDKVWEAIEDPSDGYRSYLESIQVKGSTESLIFFPNPIATVSIQKNDYLEGYNLVDVQDGHVWLEIGTDSSDGYYPYFVFRYTPKNPSDYHKDGTPKTDWEKFIEQD